MDGKSGEKMGWKKAGYWSNWTAISAPLPNLALIGFR
jgi:hypothetical protein